MSRKRSSKRRGADRRAMPEHRTTTTERRPAPRHQNLRRTALQTLGERAGESEASELIKAASMPLLAAALVTSVGTPSASALTGAPESAQLTNASLSTPALAQPGLSASEVSAKTAQPATAAFSRRVQATYVVRPGDTVSHIAERLGISARALIRANRLDAKATIHPGQRLILPGLRSAPKATGSTSGAEVIHTVREGDTVTDIATRWRVTVRSIIEANGLGPRAVIHPGQRLRIPGARSVRPTASVATGVHIVRQGDTLSSIAAAHGTTLASILRLNQLNATQVIHPGQRIKVPASSKAASQNTDSSTKATRDSNNTFLGRTYPDAVVAAADRNRAALARRPQPSRAQVRAIITQTAQRHGVDPSLALAIGWQESGFNPRVVSPANAIGTMQVIPGTGRWASDIVGRDLDLLDARDNITAGVVVLGRLLSSAQSSDHAIAGYYQGLGAVRAHGMYSDTKRYVANVRAHQRRFAAELAS